MSEVLPPELPRPAQPETWRERLAGLAESLDLTPARLVGGVVALAVVGFVAWRMLAPPPPPPEMELPFVSSSSTSVPGESTGPLSGSPSASSPSVPGDGATVVVHVAGAVASPGVQELPAGSRVVDGVDAAGGARPEADLAKINLAAPLEDGQQIYVPVLGEAAGGAAAPAAGGAEGGGATGGSGGSEVVDINTADVDQLDALPGVGPAIAQAIVDHRESNGPFASVDDLLDVRGIGEAKLADLRDRVTV